MTYTKVIIPMIRKLMPTLVASQIVGVQPMSMSVKGPRLQSRDEPYNMYPYIAQRHNTMWNLGFDKKDLDDMIEWCHATFHSCDWHYSTGNFFFRNEPDRIMFMMKWT